MDLHLSTIEAWQIGLETSLNEFVRALPLILSEGDHILFGFYEPTAALEAHFQNLGGVRYMDIPGFYMCFKGNSYSHPNGCAYELILQNDTIARLLNESDSVLRQADTQDFFDHAVAFRPSSPGLPLFTFHDASSGGWLYLSGLYDEDIVALFAKEIQGTFERVLNPVLNFCREHIVVHKGYQNPIERKADVIGEPIQAAEVNANKASQPAHPPSDSNDKN